ncbi:MAG: response regulator, partial [Poseidonibacter sp.]|uniref:response regulator n=1 Tax=Poseidonibacter sp. TaxID=2321188 RepID=UPI00359DABD5
MNKNILLVEDDLQMQKLIVDYLKDYNFNCVAFSHPKNAIKEFEQNSLYDLIILDLMLPDMDGFDLFKKRVKNSSIPTGKSGGFRVIIYKRVENKMILISIYSKTEKENLSDSELSD